MPGAGGREGLQVTVGRIEARSISAQTGHATRRRPGAPGRERRAVG